MLNKKILFYFVLAVLSIPLLQFTFSLFEEKPLMGSYYLADKPDSLFHNWFSAQFQEKYDKYFEDHFGFRNFFVRTNNQIQYDLFNKTHMTNNIAGKNGELFEAGYINSYLGKDFIGSDSIQMGLKKIDYVRNEFKKNGIEFLILIAPGKATYMPENIPEMFDLTTKDTTNYEILIKGLEQYHFNFIDLNDYFIKLKDQAEHPLFPPGGVHWSGYSMTYVFDTLFKKIENMFNISITDFKDMGGITTNKLRQTDDDVSIVMNLLFPIKNNYLYYPDIKFISDTNTTKPDVLVIGDSYAETLYRFYPFFENCFGKNTNYWSYNIWEKYPKNTNKENHKVNDLNIKSELLSRDLVILLVTQINLKYLGGLFINREYDFFKSLETDSLYNMQLKLKKLELEKSGYKKEDLDLIARKLVNKSYYREKVYDQESEIMQIIARIKTDKTWYKSVEKQAIERNIPIDSMLRLNAFHVLRNR